MAKIALETRDLAVAQLAAVPPSEFFYPLSTEMSDPLHCIFITRERSYATPPTPAVSARLIRAVQMIRYLVDCHQRMAGAAEAHEVHICSILAVFAAWWSLKRLRSRATLVLYARRTELRSLDRGSRVLVARLALRCPNVIVVESEALKEYVCTRFDVSPRRVHTVKGLVESKAAAPISALYMHPERRALFDICRGHGIDVGCGSNKTHPDALGVDLTPPGAPGKYGNQRLQISDTDVVSSGDDLHDFGDASLDYVIERHNLEHYQDPVKTLVEWQRVLRPGGMLGMVVPDDEVIDTIPLDPTHKHVFTMDSLSRLLDVIGGFEVAEKRPCIPGWSFLLIAKRT